MTTVEQITPKLENFKLWLDARGAEILVPLKGIELIKFRTVNGNSSITAVKKNGEVGFNGEAKAAWEAFCLNKSWRAIPRQKRENQKRRSKNCEALRQRDGDLCFYCQQIVSLEDESEEHLVALTHGGPQHLANKFLTHKECNNQVGHISALEKIKIHTEAVVKIALKKDLNEKFGLTGAAGK